MKRQRGYILTPLGLNKLHTQIRILETKTGFKYNPNKIAEHSQVLNPPGLHPTTVRKILKATTGVDEYSLCLLFQVLELQLEDADYNQPSKENNRKIESFQDWGEVSDFGMFYGRKLEIETLKTWVLEPCRLLFILGMGGIGKTSLAVKLGQELQTNFQFLIWRSLRNSPPLENLINQLLEIFSQVETVDTYQKSLSHQIYQLIHFFRQFRCLLILDNLETILKSGSLGGNYREEYEDYEEFFRAIAETTHQSCLIITSREIPKEIVEFQGKNLPIKIANLARLSTDDCRKILQDNGLEINQDYQHKLIETYQGNPLALKIAAASLQEIFGNEVRENLGQGIGIFKGIRSLLEQQLNRLAPLETQILFWLAINREPITFNQLRSHMIGEVLNSRLLEALEFISWRCLLETYTTAQGKTFTLQPVVMEYITGRLIDEFCAEFKTILQQGINDLEINCFYLKNYPLIKAETSENIRSLQKYLILNPIVEELLIAFKNREKLAQLFNKIYLRTRGSVEDYGYLTGNILNLLIHLEIDLRSWDFSNLTIRQGYFKGVNLQGCNFSEAHLANCIFSESFANICKIALSPDGMYLASSHRDGEVRLWQLMDGKLLYQWHPHTSTVCGLNFSSDNQQLVSSSFDGKICLINLINQSIDIEIPAHRDWVWDVIFSPEDNLIFSASNDKTIKIWQRKTGQCLKVLNGHTEIIQTITIHPRGLLASGSADQTIRIWQNYQNLVKIWRVNLPINKIVFNQDGTLLATTDGNTIKIWDVEKGECQHSFKRDKLILSLNFIDEHKLAIGTGNQLEVFDLETQQTQQILSEFSHQIWTVAWQENSQILAASDKQTIKIWRYTENNYWQLLQTIESYHNSIYSLAFSQDGEHFISGETSGRLSLWNYRTRRCLKTWQNGLKAILCTAFSSQSPLFACAGDDKIITIWHQDNAQKIARLLGHTGSVLSLDFHPQENILVSASKDGSIRLWDIDKNCLLKIISQQENWISSVTFSNDGKFLASSNTQGIIHIWSTETGQCLKTLYSQQKLIWQVAFNNQDKTLVSVGENGIIEVWNWQINGDLQLIKGHESFIFCVAFNQTGKIMATGSADRTIRLWDTITGECLKVLEGYSAAVGSIFFSQDNKTLISSSQDETIKLWKIDTWEHQTITLPRLCQNMNITGITGITPAQKKTLKTLGAREN